MICDACKLPVVPGMTSVQLQYGELVLGGGELKVKPTQSPEAFVLCRRCGDAVAAYVRYLVQVGGIDGFGRVAPSPHRREPGATGPGATEPSAERLERKAG